MLGPCVRRDMVTLGNPREGCKEESSSLAFVGVSETSGDDYPVDVEDRLCKKLDQLLGGRLDELALRLESKIQQQGSGARGPRRTQRDWRSKYAGVGATPTSPPGSQLNRSGSNVGSNIGRKSTLASSLPTPAEGEFGRGSIFDCAGTHTYLMSNVKQHARETEVNMRPSHGLSTTNRATNRGTLASRSTLLQSHSRSWLERAVASMYFELFWATAILTNSILVGVQANRYATGPSADPVDFAMMYIIWGYTMAFTVELLMRMGANGKAFFTDTKQCIWNYFDLFIVTISIVEMVFDIIIWSAGQISGSGTLPSSSGNATGVRVLRILRITRLVRIIRIIRIVRFIRALRTLVYSIIGTIRSLVWAMLLLIMIIYVYAVIFTQAVADHLLSGGGLTPRPGFALYWSSVPRSMLTLFEAIVGGISWDVALVPIFDVGWPWVFLFIIYICFTFLAVLNVVTGVFCQSAIEGSQHDQEMLIQEKMKNKTQYMDRVRQLFESIDEDGSGTITIQELEDHLNDAAMQAYFQSLDIDTSDAWALFKLLDSEGSHRIDCEDFVDGCMRLKGAAKAIDLAQLIHEQKNMRRHFMAFVGSVESSLESLLEQELFTQETLLRRQESREPSTVTNVSILHKTPTYEHDEEEEEQEESGSPLASVGPDLLASETEREFQI